MCFSLPQDHLQNLLKPEDSLDDDDLNERIIEEDRESSESDEEFSQMLSVDYDEK